jgi:transcriptional regulator with XRE-family HTH domain
VAAASPRTAELAALGAAIRQFRKAKRLSQERLALDIGVSRNQIGRVERAEQSPTFDRLVLIARGLELPLTDLMQRYEDGLQAAAAATRPSG